MNKVLVIEAHSDDSAISASGYLRKLKKLNWELNFLLVSSSRIKFNHVGDVFRDVRLLEYKNYVNDMQGIWHREFDFPFDKESELDLLPRKVLVSALEKVIAKVKPNKLIIQGSSFHHDHTAVYEAAIAATRPTALFYPNQILIMENPTYVHSLDSTTDFKPNYYVPLSKLELDEKTNKFSSIFTSQIRPKDNVLSVDGLESWARYRGIECRVRFAEAFRLYTNIENI